MKISMKILGIFQTLLSPSPPAHPKHELQAHGVVVEEHDPTHYEECVPPPVFWISHREPKGGI